ncbi:MAG: hypothetical protein MK008_14315 [Bdellovibrionales bacterium]|nr:hypothetical protein [Bdellovibrionales bacterium]
MRNILLYFGLATLLLFSYQNCSNPEIAFKTLGSTDPNQTLEVPIDGNKTLVTENLGIKTTSRNIDFVWVIDNSGSMSAEAQAVNNNYLAFMQNISSRAEIRSSLISATNSKSTGVSIPKNLEGENHKQFPITVSSVNGMSHATGSLLTKNECESNPSLYFNSSGSSNCDYYVKSDNNRDFLRVNSKKIFVFVTDDNERYTDTNKFLNAFNTAYPSQSPIVYSFIGLQNSVTNCYARIGSAYDNLSMNTQGGVFDICQQDWSQHFNDMIDHVFVSTENIFNIKHETFEEIMEVKVDDVILSKDQYTVDNNTITIKPELLSESSKRVTVKYIILK